ncbi:MAG: DUF3820 family protein [Pseudomonadota bacterium]|nr:hypothetical protein [Pseudomonas sp.]MEC8442999.1 DUF3820 family protein [Pseudomonadota bacterium]
MRQEDLIALVEWTMPFGKYQGRRLCDLPEEYLLWMSNREFPEGYLGHLLAVMLELRIHGLEDLLTPLKASRPAKLRQPPPENLQ